MRPTIDGSVMRRLVLPSVIAILLVAVGVTLAVTGSNGPLQNVKAFAYGSAPTPSTPPTNPAGCERQYGDSAQGDQCLAALKRSAALKRCAKKPSKARAACKKSARKAYTKRLAKLTACSNQRATAIGKLNPEAPEYGHEASAILVAEHNCKALVK